MTMYDERKTERKKRERKERDAIGRGGKRALFLEKYMRGGDVMK